MKYLKYFENLNGTITISSSGILNMYQLYVDEYERNINAFKNDFDLPKEEIEEILYLDSLKDKIHIGKYFDWKEDEALYTYIDTLGEDNYFFYNSYPDGDGWHVVYSEIKIKNAEKITTNKKSAKQLQINRKTKQFDL